MAERGRGAEIGTFGQSLKSVRCADEAMAVLMDAVADFGYRHARYGFIPVYHSGAKQTDWRFLFSMPDGGEEMFYGDGPPSRDYATWHAARFRRPITIAEIDIKSAAGELSDRQRRTHDLARGKGFRNGVIIPLREDFPLSRGVLTFVAAGEKSADSFERDRRKHMLALCEIAHTFHGNLHRPCLLDEKQHPSGREIECLSAVMRGMRTKQIAHQLGTNVKTVEKQLSSARRRLSARTNTQAAVKAVVFGLIAPG